MSDSDLPERITIWESFLDPRTSWALFKQGTCVDLGPRPNEVDSDVASRARSVLAEFGPVHPGSGDADFTIMPARDHSHWLVRFYRHDILGLVLAGEVMPNAEEFEIGLFGRAKRAKDAADLEVVHVHVTRTPGDLYDVVVQVRDLPERLDRRVPLFSRDFPDAEISKLQDGSGIGIRLPVLSGDDTHAGLWGVQFARDRFGYACSVSLESVERL